MECIAQEDDVLIDWLMDGLIPNLRSGREEASPSLFRFILFYLVWYRLVWSGLLGFDKEFSLGISSIL